MFSPWTCRILRLGFFLSICALGLSSAHAQQVGVSWTGNAGTGNWNDPTNWNPAVVPDNAGSTTYSVTINAPNEGASVFGAVFGAGLTIDNLTLGATNGLGGDDAIISLVSGASTNNGSISLDLSTLSINSGASLLNNGSIGLLQSTLNINSGASFINNGPISQELLPAFLYNNGSFVNNSEISEIADGNIINDGSGQFANLGTIYLDSGHFTNVGTFNNTGAITLVTLSDPIDFTNSGTFNNGGTINISIINFAGSTFSNSGTLNNASTINLDYLPECCFSLSNSGTLNNAGVLNIASATFFGNSPNNQSFLNSGTINNSGALNIGTISFGGTSLVANFFTNSGTLNNTGTVSNGSVSTIYNTGLIINAGTLNNTGIFANSGSVNISSAGLFTTSTNYTQTAGSTLVDGTLSATGGAIVDIQGGTLRGTGTINGNVLMAGTMMPGDAPGTLTILGNYEQTGTGIFDELMAPGSQSFLDVSGNVVLDPGASLEISLLGGFDPLGDTISIMDFSTLSGQFANGSSFWDDNYLWNITYRQHEIDVTAVQAPEPATFPLLAVGLIALLYSYRKSSHSSWHDRSDLQ